MVVCYASTNTIGQIIDGLINIAGSLFLALIIILVILIVIALALSLPLEATGIIYLPLLITFAACESDFKGAIGAALIFFGFMLAKWIMPK